MARNITLSALRSRIRERGEIDNNYISDAVLNDWINESLADLYDQIVATSSDYFLDSSNINVVSGTDAYALPATFYKALGVDVNEGGQWFSMRRFNWGERNTFNVVSGQNQRTSGYRIMGGNLRIIPSPSWSSTVRLWFIPAPPKLVLDADTWDGIAGWEEFAVLDVLIKFYGKEESDPSVFIAQRDNCLKRIVSLATDRDEGEPKRVRDVYTERARSVLKTYYNP
jgi:hypothetical protein